MDGVDGVLASDVSRVAFRRLLQAGGPAPIAVLAADLGRAKEEAEAAVAALSAEGRIRLDERGRVMGAAGLSVVPDRHRIDFGERTFWTWCANDALGIVGALRASGVAHSVSPYSGQALKVRFRLGRPQPTSIVLFRPDDDFRSRCANVYEEWCPNSNFFESREAASAWSQDHRLHGRILDLAEASGIATGRWEPLTEGLGV
jgi:hypothetical protein